MNKKQYCVPAVTVAEGKLQPMLVSASQLKSMQNRTLKFDTDAQDNSIDDDAEWVITSNSPLSEDDGNEWNF